MNLRLAIPACCCLGGFVLLYSALEGADRGASRTTAEQVSAPQPVVATPIDLAIEAASHSAQQAWLTPEEAEQLVSSERDKLMAPWREWQQAPHRIYSRVYIPLETFEAEFQFAAIEPDSPLALGALTIQRGELSTAVPFVVDRHLATLRLFHDGHWLDAEAWLAAAPRPRREGGGR